jgi:3-oxoacyl-[acyl-carrier-protein] synthase II
MPRCATRAVRTHDGVRQIEVFQAPEVALSEGIPDAVKRRMARVTRMGLAAAMQAVTDAFGPQRKGIYPKPERIGLVVGTAFGCLSMAIDHQDRVLTGGAAGVSPSIFSGSIHNAIASQLSISLGIRGPMSTVTTMEHTAIGAMRLAFDWLNADRVDHVVVVIGDELSEFHSYMMANLDVARDFDPQSDACSAIAGEGMAGFVISRPDAPGVRQRHCQITDVRAFAERCPVGQRYFVGCHGGEGQWSRHLQWIRHNAGTAVEPQCHARLFGSMVTAVAFEILVGALLVRTDGCRTICVQLTDHGEPQTLTLG